LSAEKRERTAAAEASGSAASFPFFAISLVGVGGCVRSAAAAAG
jgi:hypothetical protein